VLKNFDKEEELVSESKPDNFKSYPQSSKNNLSQTVDSPLNPTYSLLHSKVNSGSTRRNQTNRQP
jgi:hypothetical protein